MTLNANIGFYWHFWQLRAATHISRANCAEITTDRPGQPAYGIFDIESSFH